MSEAAQTTWLMTDTLQVYVTWQCKRERERQSWLSAKQMGRGMMILAHHLIIQTALCGVAYSRGQPEQVLMALD